MFKPGDKLKEGVVVKVGDDGGVLVGREAEPGEATPAGFSEHVFGTRRVFLHPSQGAIHHSRLHKAGK